MMMQSSVEVRHVRHTIFEASIDNSVVYDIAKVKKAILRQWDTIFYGLYISQNEHSSNQSIRRIGVVPPIQIQPMKLIAVHRRYMSKRWYPIGYPHNL
ncbi:hypothetical protein GOBAR_DD11496 [Gossypium barbadense]|nr:hypothetical protein GOBAR_DD11496 [Gossypium barbadense]